ncbi:MAG: hypothetical protein CMH57_02765 [Myxococcales bacterium]|nr:hypothetical protein [Myxococcales bacterium]
MSRGSKRRTYGETEAEKDAFRKEAVRRSYELGSIRAAAFELDVAYATLRHWRLDDRYRPDDDELADLLDGKPLPRRDGSGYWLPGSSGNPGGRSSLRAAAEQIAAEQALSIIILQRELLKDLVSEDDERRARAIRVLEPGGRVPHVFELADRLLDRGIGKVTAPPELVGAGGESIGPVKVAEIFTHIYNVPPDQGPDLDRDLAEAEADDEEEEEGGGGGGDRGGDSGKGGGG